MGLPEAIIQESTYNDGFRGSNSTAQVGDFVETKKQCIRDRLRRRRRALSPEEAGRLSYSVCCYAKVFPRFQRASSVGLYLPVDNEVDPSSLRLDAALSGKSVFLPVVDRTRGTLVFVRYKEDDPLTLGAFGIREPSLPSGVGGSGEAGCCAVSDLDILFLPLVAFDRFGWRLGYGGGYYDRALAPKRSAEAFVKKTLLVGLAYHFQEVRALPYAAHDVPMDFVMTDQACLAMAPQNG